MDYIYNCHPWIGYDLEKGVCLKLDVRGQGSGRIVDIRWTRVVRGLENWTVFMDDTCLSSQKGIDISNTNSHGFEIWFATFLGTTGFCQFRDQEYKKIINYVSTRCFYCSQQLR